MKFKEFKAIDFCDAVKDGTHASPKRKEQGFKLITSKHIRENRIDFDNAYYISSEDYKEVNKRSKVDINDILFSMIGTIGLIYRIDFEPNFAIKNIGLFKIKDEIKSKWLYYYLKSPYMGNYIKTLMSGSTQQYITLDNLRNLPIRFPNNEKLTYKIINVLEKIDKKIELNTQINENLYEIMKLKFSEWIESLQEYEISNLSSIANYKNGLAMQKYRPENEIGLPVIKIKEMNSGVSAETERCKSNIDSEVIINNGDVLFAWSGTLCMTIWDSGKAGLNQHIFKVTSDKYPKWFYYFWTLKHLDKFIQIAAGKATTMGHIKRGELDLAEVLVPTETELEDINKIMSPMLEKFIQNKIENRTLEQLRDTLLPKLMNGEIDLENIEI